MSWFCTTRTSSPCVAASLALTFFSSCQVFSSRRYWPVSSRQTNAFRCASFMRGARGVYCPRPPSLLLRPSLLGVSGLNHCACATLGKMPFPVPDFLPTSLLPTVAPTTCNQLCRLRRCNISGRLPLKNSFMWCGQRSWHFCSGVHSVFAHVQ